MHIRLCIMVKDELVCYIMKLDCSDGCYVAFAVREFAVGQQGLCLDGVIIKLVDVILPNNENRMA